MEMKPKKELIRVVRTPEGDLKLDDRGRMNGRGAYICRDAACLSKAMKSRGLERSLDIRIPEEIFFNLQKEMSLIEER